MYIINKKRALFEKKKLFSYRQPVYLRSVAGHIDSHDVPILDTERLEWEIAREDDTSRVCLEVFDDEGIISARRDIQEVAADDVIMTDECEDTVSGEGHIV